jgi:hypothetical protein
MRTLLALAIAGFVLVSYTPADEQLKPSKDSYDDLLASMVKTLNGVGDKSAKEATPKLQKLASEMDDLRERAEKLGKPSQKDLDALEAKYKNDLGSAAKNLAAEIERLKGQPFGKSVLDTLKTKPKIEKPK